MITVQQAQQAKERHAAFIQEAANYRSLLASLDLPFSVNLPALQERLKQRLADELLKLDPSLKLRWELLRTDAGREKLRAEVTATIDLDGYEDAALIEASLTSLKRAYAFLGSLPDQYRLNFEVFANAYELDLAKLIDSRTMVWEGKEQVLTYFTTLAEHLQQAREMLAYIGRHNAMLEDVARSLTSYYQIDLNSRRGPWLTIDEQALYQLASTLQEEGKLDGFPQSVTR